MKNTILIICSYFLVCFFCFRAYKEIKPAKVELDPNRFVGIPYETLAKTKPVILLPKDTSKYHGNWVDINK